MIRLRFDVERYWVSDDDLDLYGVGDTIADARQDYWLAAQDYYADLSANADRLTSRLQVHLEVLHRVLLAEEKT